MKNNAYMDRAERARDPRYARILGRLGYERRDMVAGAAAPVEDIASVRDEYERALGKRPFNGWDAATLREKIAAAKD
jgi:hypothetical protein